MYIKSLHMQDLMELTLGPWVYPLFADHQTPPQCLTLKDTNSDIALTIACVDVKYPEVSFHEGLGLYQ